MMDQGKQDQVQIAWFQELQDDLQTELDSARRELNDISLMLDQSQLEVGKLTQRNAAATSRMQQAQAQLERMPPHEIRTVYEQALDAQQRLFMMRGQLEKLQSDRSHLQRYASMIERLLDALAQLAPSSNTRDTSSMVEMVEMVIQAQETERQRLARQMHDEPAQALSNFILQTEIAMRLFDVDQSRAKEELASLKTAATSTFQKVRDFIFELRPMMLDDLGLGPTIQRYIQVYKDQSGMDIRLTQSGMEQRFESYLEVMIFRSVQEMLHNAVHHSQGSVVKVQLDVYENTARVTVEDNGRGFDTGMLAEKGMGIKLIRDRVEMLGGSFTLDSTKGQGTRLTFQVPVTPSPVFANM